MRQQVATLGTIIFVAGCSLIYNPSNIGHGDAGHVMTADAPPDAEVVADGDPSMLTITGVSPLTILEGQGDGSSREVLLVLAGTNIASDATVAIAAASGSAMIEIDGSNAQVSHDEDFLAVPVTSLVDIGLAAGSSVPLTITVTQTSQAGAKVATLTGMLTLTGLDELTAQTATLEPLYSRVTLGSATTWTGGTTSPIVLTATSSITVADITASGGAASAATAGSGGPGGCAGGAAESAGECGSFAGIGGAATAAGGGGGAGFAAPGSTGGGTGGGQAGGQAGSPQVLVYVDQSTNSNRASGGGGGGGAAGTLGTGTGGAGGGGGGAIELTAGGAISAANLITLGGNGGKGAVGGVGGTGGGGGGGAGGVVVLRSAHDKVSLTGTVQNTGGAGGAGAGTGAGTGGPGAAGRIRWDQPTGSVPVMAHRGLSFAVDTPFAFTTATPMITVLGTMNDRFDVYIQDDTGTPLQMTEPSDVTLGGDTVMFQPTLVRGYNRLCITAIGGTRGGSLADTCIDVAFLP